MRHVAMLLISVLLATTAFAQSQAYTEDPSQIPQFVAKQPLGQKLYIKLKTGKYRDGALTRINADSFEITFKKKVEKIAYAEVALIAAVPASPTPAPAKLSFWTRVKYGALTGVAIAGIGAILAISYPSTLASDGATKVKAKSLRKAVAKSLRPGASKAQVMAFLAAQKIDPADITAAKGDQPDPLTGQVKKINQIVASLDGHNWFAYHTNFVHITFFFDDADRMTDFKVEADSYFEGL